MTMIKALTPHNTYLLQIWDASDCSLKCTLTQHEKWVWDCAFSADPNFLVTGSSDKHVLLWDLSRGEVVRSYTGHTKAVTAIAINDNEV